MKKVIVNIPEGKLQFFTELINSLDFVTIDEETNNEIPQWQIDETRNRVQESSPEEYKTWDEVKAEIDR